MPASITLPLWLAIVIGALAAWALLAYYANSIAHLLVPATDAGQTPAALSAA